MSARRVTTLALSVTALTLIAAPAAAQWPAQAQVPSAPAQPQLQPQYGQPAPPTYPIQPQPAPSIPGMPQVILPPVPVPGQEETVQRLDRAKASDAGRRLEWVWIDAHGGFEQLGLRTFAGDQSITGGAAIKSSSSGAVVGVGVGARLLFLTLLLRARLGVGAIGQLYRIGPEIGLHIPFGRVEPHVELGGGYGIFGKLNDGGTGAATGMLIHGGYGRVGAGVDFYVAPILSLGVGLSAELLGLARPAVSGGTGALAQSASSLGGTLAATGVVALHF